MLYLSTRSRTDLYTSNRALHEERAPDGGLYVPYQMPLFTGVELHNFKTRSFNENLSYILNLFFSSKLNSWDVEFCCGRSPAKRITLPHRLHVVELWHNTNMNYAHIERSLYQKLTNSEKRIPPFSWAKIAINIAVLFAIYGETATVELGAEFDLVVETTDFVAPFAAWYARQMGLPINTIVCATQTNDEIWQFLHFGTINTSSITGETIGLERLIWLNLGLDAVLQYVDSYNNQHMYALDDDCVPSFNRGLFATVISADRLPAVISNCYRSYGYIFDTVSAISFGALQDFRARTGESRNTLIMSTVSPLINASAMTNLLGISTAELEIAVNEQRGY